MLISKAFSSNPLAPMDTYTYIHGCWMLILPGLVTDRNRGRTEAGLAWGKTGQVEQEIPRDTAVCYKNVDSASCSHYPLSAHSKARGNGVCTLDSSGRILLSVGTCVPLLRIHILKLPRKAQMTQSYSNPLSPWMPS